MKTILKAAALGAAAIATLPAVTAPAFAQAKQGIGVVNLDRSAAESNAYRTAMQQMQTTYKATIDSLNTRKAAIEADLKGKNDALQAALKAAGDKPTPAIQTQYQQLQQDGQKAQQELQQIGLPIARANAYVEEQLALKIGDALKAAMTKAKVDIVLKEGATESFVPAADLTDEVTAELNTLVPSVSITPPANWQPGQAGQQPAPAAAPASAAQKPSSR